MMRAACCTTSCSSTCETGMFTICSQILSENCPCGTILNSSTPKLLQLHCPHTRMVSRPRTHHNHCTLRTTCKSPAKAWAVCSPFTYSQKKHGWQATRLLRCSFLISCRHAQETVRQCSSSRARGVNAESTNSHRVAESLARGQHIKLWCRRSPQKAMFLS